MDSKSAELNNWIWINFNLLDSKYTLCCSGNKGLRSKSNYHWPRIQIFQSPQSEHLSVNFPFNNSNNTISCQALKSTTIRTFTFRTSTCVQIRQYLKTDCFYCLRASSSISFNFTPLVQLVFGVFHSNFLNKVQKLLSWLIGHVF